MERIARLVFLTGLCFLSIRAARFVLFFAPNTWGEAQSLCRRQCIDLATFSDMEDMNNILSFIEGKYDDAIWFGLWKGQTRSWHWSLTAKDFYQGEEKNYFTFLWLQKPIYHCGTYKNGYLDAIPCSSALPAVCFDATKAGMDQYVVVNKAGLSWTSAQAFCRTSYTDLTSVRNEVEAGMIQKLLGDMQAWVGLFRDPWVWSDQADSSLRFWPVDQQVWSEGVQACGALLKNESGQWGGRNCSEKHPFFCSCKNTDTKQTYIKVKFNLKNSALDLNNPAVQNNILQQMKLKQNEDGIAVMQTQWRKQPNGKIFVKEAPDDD